MQEVHGWAADERNMHRARAIVDLLRRRDLVDHAMIHYRDAIGHRHRFDLVVCDVNGGRADAIVQRTQLDAHEMPEFGVERAERLVHHEGFRLPHDRAAERDALAVAAGQAGHRTIDQVLDAQELRDLFHARADLAPGHTLALQREADVAAHVHVRIQREQLEHEADVALRRALECHVVAIEQHLAGRGNPSAIIRSVLPADGRAARELAVRDERRRAYAVKSPKRFCRCQSYLSAALRK
jgi:hypothetical protein